MKKFVIPTLLVALIIGLSGCSTPPPATSDTQDSLRSKFQKMSAEILGDGGWAAVGFAESKSLDIAINKAKIDGRIKLADLLEARTNGVPKNLTDQIQSLAPKLEEHETTNGVFTAYALIGINPEILNQETKTLSTE